MKCKECQDTWVEVSDGAKILLCKNCHTRKAAFNVLQNPRKIDKWTDEAIKIVEIIQEMNTKMEKLK